MHPFLNRQFHFRARDVVLIPIDNGPNRFFGDGPAAGKNSEMKHRGKRFPIFTHQKWRNPTLNRSYAPGRFTVAGRDAIPDALDIFPTLPAHSIEKRELQVVSLVSAPAIGDVDHVPGLEPFVAIDSRCELKFVLTPG